MPLPSLEGMEQTEVIISVAAGWLFSKSKRSEEPYFNNLKYIIYPLFDATIQAGVFFHVFQSCWLLCLVLINRVVCRLV